MAEQVTRWEDNDGNLHDTEESADRADAWSIIKGVIDQALADGDGELDLQCILSNRATLVTALEALD